jgi:hypothetical protein
MTEALNAACPVGNPGCHDESDSVGRLLSDQQWELLEPLIPPLPPAKNGRTGRPRVDDRAALEGILFVTTNGIA